MPLIGLQVDLLNLALNLLPIGIAVVAVLLARAIVVYGLGLIVLPLPPVLPLRWLHVLFWAGMRGALSLAVVLSLPLELPARALLLNLTYGVVLFSLLVQGLTMRPLLAWLGLTADDQQRQIYQARRAQLLLLRAGWRELRRLEDDAVLSPRVYAQLDAQYRADSAQIEAALEGLYQDQSAFEAEEQRSTQVHLLQIERSTLQDLRRQGLIDDDTSRKLAESLDTRLMAVRSGAHDHAAPSTPPTAQLEDAQAGDAPETAV